MNETPVMAFVALYFFVGILMARCAYLWDRHVDVTSLAVIAATPPFGFIGWAIHAIVVARLHKKLGSAGIVSMDP